MFSGRPDILPRSPAVRLDAWPLTLPALLHEGLPSTSALDMPHNEDAVCRCKSPKTARSLMS